MEPPVFEFLKIRHFKRAEEKRVRWEMVSFSTYKIKRGFSFVRVYVYVCNV
jgi:hypothetical protein